MPPTCDIPHGTPRDLHNLITHMHGEAVTDYPQHGLQKAVIIYPDQGYRYNVFGTRNVSNNTNNPPTLSKLTLKIQMFSIRNPSPKTTSLITVASAHIHMPRNNPAKFHDNPMNEMRYG